MLKKYVLFLLLISLIFVFIGCGSGSEEYFEPVTNSVVSEVVNGHLELPATSDGTKVTAEDNTFSDRAVISIIESNFSGLGSDYLDNAEKSYLITGYLKSDNLLEKDIPITRVEKPITVRLKNPFKENVEYYCIGLRKSKNEDWNFTRVDDSYSVGNSSTRAAKAGVDIVFNTTELGIEVALFAKINGSGKLVPATVVNKVKVGVTSEKDSSPSVENCKIKINSQNCYDDNMKIVLKLEGLNVSSLKSGDYIAEISFLNNKPEELAITNEAVKYEQQPDKSSGLGDKYVHKLLIRNIAGDADSLYFVLNTKNFSTSDFPMNFSVVIKNTDSIRETLPFNYEQNLKVEEDQGPSAPRNITISDSIARYGEPVTFKWQSSDEPDDVTFAVVMSRDGEDEVCVAENIKTTEWTSSTGSDALATGSWVVRIVARNAKGLTSYSEPIELKVVDAIKSPEIANLEKSYRLGKTIDLVWAETTDPLSEKSFAYDVILTNSDGSEKRVAKGLVTNSFKLEDLETGFYIVAVEATNGDIVIKSNDKIFQVRDPEAPAIPANVKVSGDKVREGDTVTLTWDPDSEETVTYNVYLKDSSNPEDKVADNISETSWTSSRGSEALNKGDYTARIEAVNSHDLKSSEIATFSVVSAEPDAAVINDMAYSHKVGEPVTVSWSAAKDALDAPIKYSVMLSKNGETPTQVVSDIAETFYDINSLEIGSYSVVISATNGIGSSDSLQKDFQVIDGSIPAPVVASLEKNTYRVGESIVLNWSPVSDPMGNKIVYNLWVYSGDKTSEPNYANIQGTSVTLTNLATGSYKTELVATNGDVTSAPASFEEFQVYTSARASLETIAHEQYLCNYYGTEMEFIVSVSEKNFDEENVAAAVNITGVDSSKVVKNWVDGRLHVKYSEPLPLGLAGKITMASVKDSFENNIEPFNNFNFNVIPFPGKGTDEEPFQLNAVAAVQMTNSDELPLIASLTSSVGAFRNMVFYDGVIKSGSDVLWNSLDVANVDDNPVIDIPMNEMWASSTAYPDVNMNFKGSLEGTTYTFVTGKTSFTTESGLVISIGDGSKTSPYLVYTPNQFDEVRNHLSSNLKQMRNIDLTGYSSPTCVPASTGFKRFGDSFDGLKGVYDGGGRYVANLRMNSGGDTALFGSISGENAELKNLGVVNGYIQGSGSWVAALVAEQLRGNLTNCYAENTTVKGNGGSIGGLVGRYNGGTVSGCHFIGTVETTAYNLGVGGLIGDYNGSGGTGHVFDCYVKDSTIKGTEGVGGFFGYDRGCALVENCYVEGCTVTGGYQTGGFLGQTYAGMSIKNCYAICDVTGGEYSGGFAGNLSGAKTNTIISGCYCSGNFSFTGNCSGGFIGYNNYFPIENCYIEADLVTFPSGQDVGGFIGFNGGVVTNCYAKITKVDAPHSQYVGGLVGYTTGGSLNDCYAIVDNVDAGSNAGVLVGQNYGTANRCYAKGNASGSSNVGILMGYSSSEVKECCAIGSARGTYMVGGLMGYNGYKVSNCYAQGEVIGGNIVGGLLGSTYNEVHNCYAAVTCSGTTNVGSLIGTFESSGSCKACFTTQPGTMFGTGSGSLCYYLPDGYTSSKNWSSYAWNEDIWNLEENTLPTLKNVVIE